MLRLLAVFLERETGGIALRLFAFFRTGNRCTSA